MQISVGIPCYNEERNIANLLNLLLEVSSRKSESYHLTEILIVDDGSIDKTAEIVKSYAKADSRVRLVRLPNRVGLATVSEYVLRNTAGDATLVIAGDSLPSRDSLERMAAYLKSHPETALIMARKKLILSVQNGFFRVTRFSRVLNDYAGVGVLNGRYFVCLGTCMMLISRELRSSLSIPPDAVGVDVYVYLSCISLGYNFKFLTDAVVYYKGPSNFTDFLLQHARFKQMLYKWLSDAEFRPLLECEIRRTSIAVVRAFLSNFILKPLDGLLWLIAVLVATMLSPNYKTEPRWRIALTTK